MLVPTILAFALPALSAPLTARAEEQWSIPTMAVHFMGRDTGIPGNTWPDDRKFNTTLSFTLDQPTSSVNCAANWEYQKVSTAEWQCGDGVSFHLSPTPDGSFSDSQWTLTVSRAPSYVASKVIKSNSAGSPDSYLSCIGGAPYDGIRCSLGGWAGHQGPIVLTAESP